MKALQKKLDFLLEKYSVDTKAVLKDEKTVAIDGAVLPLLAHRSQRRFIELKNIVQGGTLVGISVMRVARIVEKSADLYAQLYRELDLCQFVLGRKIVSVMAMQNDNTLNVIATAEDGVVCTLEIAATLAKGEPAKDKHEVISQRGTACDIVVDAQLAQDSVYLFGKKNKKHTDVDFELFGLSAEETAIVRAAFALAKNKNFGEVQQADSNLRCLVELAKRSAATGEREVM